MFSLSKIHTFLQVQKGVKGKVVKEDVKLSAAQLIK